MLLEYKNQDILLNTDPVNTAANHLSILIVTKLFNRDRMKIKYLRCEVE